MCGLLITLPLLCQDCKVHVIPVAQCDLVQQGILTLATEQDVLAVGCAVLAVTFFILFLTALPSSRLARGTSSSSLASGAVVDLTSPQGNP